MATATTDGGTTLRANDPPLRSRKTPLLRRQGFAAFVFLAPFVILFVVFRVYAIGRAVTLSFQDIQGFGLTEWAGLDNYRQLIADGTFHTALRNTAMYALGTLLILIPLPLVLAAILHSGIIKRRMMFRSLFFLPVLTSLVVVGVVFQLLLTPNGLVNQALDSVGLPALGWLNTRHLAIPSLLIMATWRWTGINIVYFTTGLSNIPDDLYEAASIDGAGAFRRFWHLSVPLSKPIILFVTVLSLFGGFQLFVEPYILWATGGGPGQAGLSIVILLYREAFTSFRLGYAAAIGVVLAGIIMCVSLVQLYAFGFFKKDK